MRKYLIVLALLILVVVGAFLYFNEPSKNQTQDDFSEQEAIEKVLELHPEFPSKPNEVKTVSEGDLDRFWYELQLGATKVGENTYLISLGKNNRLVVDGEVIEQYWIYKVSPNSIELIDSKNNTELMSKFR